MTLLSTQIQAYLERSSWIRKMFETGAKLKAEYGADAVYDFSLGNPDLPPPPTVALAMHDLADKAAEPFSLGYMPNTGYPWVRESLARFVSEEQGFAVSSNDIIVTCGAAGALNALFRAVLEPGDQVLGPAPFFVEYVFYAENANGTFVPVPAQPLTFALDLAAMEAAITKKTRVVLINSPNNPTGAVYTREELRGLSEILARKSAQYGRPILLASDEPYRFLVFDGVEAPSILPFYDYSVVISSFSKNLSLAGERVGYAVIHPAMAEHDELMNGMALTNRILGYVNAPAIGQVLAAKSLNTPVDVTVYDDRRKAMAKVLDEAGIEYTMPKGAFYFFPKVPDSFDGDDVAFVNALQEERILAVPGRGFGCPGYFRLAFCVDEEVINRSAEGFKKAVG